MTVNMHYVCHAVLFQSTCIFAGEYSGRILLSPRSSLLAIRRLIVSKQM